MKDYLEIFNFKPNIFYKFNKHHYWVPESFPFNRFDKDGQLNFCEGRARDMSDIQDSYGLDLTERLRNLIADFPFTIVEIEPFEDTHFILKVVFNFLLKGVDNIDYKTCSFCLTQEDIEAITEVTEEGWKLFWDKYKIYYPDEKKSK